MIVNSIRKTLRVNDREKCKKKTGQAQEDTIEDGHLANEKYRFLQIIESSLTLDRIFDFKEDYTAEMKGCREQRIESNGNDVIYENK